MKVELGSDHLIQFLLKYITYYITLHINLCKSISDYMEYYYGVGEMIVILIITIIIIIAQFLIICHVPGPVLGALHSLPHLILRTERAKILAPFYR